MKTQAAVLTKVGGPLEVLELEVPPLSPGQVLVEMRYSGVCGTQLGELNGSRGPDRWLPHCLGHEGTGVVLAVGPGVTRVCCGDEVVLSWIQGPGMATFGASYQSALGAVNSGPVATLMRHAVVGETRLSQLPSELSLREGVALGCPAPTGLGSVKNVLETEAGESLVVFGAGGVGLFAILGGLVSRAGLIVGVDPNPKRRQLACDWGASETFDPSKAHFHARIVELLGDGASGIVDATGRPDVATLALSLVRARGGQVVVVGNAPHGSRLSIDPAEFNQGKSIRGTWGGDANPAVDFSWMGQALAGVRERVADLYSQAFSLEEVNWAFKAMASGTVGRALIDMDLI